jgi:Mg-chelatase subunit ChlD
METKHKVFNLVILDESGSMESVRNATISGFNELVQTIKGVEAQFPEQEHLVSLVTFNGQGIRTPLWNEPVQRLKEINSRSYQPNSFTPLFDAMGTSLTRLRGQVESLKDYNVLVTVITDGEENSSKEYSGKAIKDLVDHLSQLNWTFSYIGANHDVADFAMKISITNTLTFDAHPEGMKKMFDQEKNARANFSRKIRDKEDLKKNYYDQDPRNDKV